MGSFQSTNEKYDEAVKLYSQSERNQIRKLYTDILGTEADGTKLRKGFDLDTFQNHAKRFMVVPLDIQLFKYMLNEHKQTITPEHRDQVIRVNFESFFVAVYVATKGTLTEKCELACQLANGDSKTTRISLQKLVEVILKSYIKIQQNDNGAIQSWRLKPEDGDDLEKFSTCILLDLDTQGGKIRRELVQYDPSQTFNEEEIEFWLSRSSLLLRMLDCILFHCFPVNFAGTEFLFDQTLIPTCEHIDWNKTDSLLDLPSLILLNSSLPMELRTNWRLLFSSTIHGESFATMIKHILQMGPTLVVIKDSDGHIFGGFASQSWGFSPRFVGSNRCFLFSIFPSLALYIPTGYNDNYMYLNQAQETFPNGLGFGGQLNYFGLWLDHEYGTGHCRAEPLCTTYNSPQLSKQADFKMEIVEVWGLGPDPKLNQIEDEDGVEKMESILDRDPQAKAMLALLDKGPLSEGLRETDPMASSPGQHELPPTTP